MLLENKSKEALSILENRYYFIYKLISFSNISSSSKVKFDIAPLVYTVADYALACAKKDRVAFAKETFEWITKRPKASLIDKILIKKIFRKRVDFYSEVIRGKKVYGDCFLAENDDVNNGNPVFRVAIAYSDCIITPEYIDDYDKYRMPTQSIIELFNFIEITVKPLAEQLTLLYKDIYEA